jgi:preprotein translocase subunit SecY
MLVASRFIAHVPMPGADLNALQRLVQTNQLAGFFDLFSGGALSSLSVAALGVYPYITAQIIMQIMQPAIPQLQAIAKEGESGRQKINQWTHWLTVPLAMLQAYGTPNLINFSTGGGAPIIKNFGFDQDPLGTLAIVISMTAGSSTACIRNWRGYIYLESTMSKNTKCFRARSIVGPSCCLRFWPSS